MAENLIIYFSREGQNYVAGKVKNLEKGNARLLAEYIQKAVGADVFRVETVRTYSEDYMTCTVEAKEELREKARPELKAYLENLDGYENIFLVGPNWWGVYPMAMYSQLERLDFAGKHVFPVVTHEGSGLGSTMKTLEQVCAGAVLAKGLEVAGSKVPDSEKAVAKWAAKQVRHR